MALQRGLDRQQIRQIKGLSGLRRLPRLGKIRLGVLVRKPRTPQCRHQDEEWCRRCAYPKETEHFVCPPEVEKVYGEHPRELVVMFPMEDLTVVFPQAYKWYGESSGLKCKGDGETAIRRWADVEDPLRRELGGTHGENDLVEIPCPCPRLESGECSQVGNLMVILPEVNVGGVYQIDTGSFYNIVELNSTIDYLKALLGRIALIPLKLRREAMEIPFQGKKRTHYLLRLVFEGDLAMVQRLREQARWIPSPRFALPEPVEDGPEPTGPPPVVEDQDDQPEAPTSAPSDVPPLDTNDGTSPAGGPPTPPAVWAELGVFLAQAKLVLSEAEGVVPDPSTMLRTGPERAGDLIPYPDVALGLDRWLRMEFKLPGGFEDLKAAAPETQAMVLLRMRAFKDLRGFLLKLGAGATSGGLTMTVKEGVQGELFPNDEEPRGGPRSSAPAPRGRRGSGPCIPTIWPTFKRAA